MSAVDELESTRMTLGEHLDELRRRVFKSVIALAVTFALAWVFRDRIADYVLWPYQSAAARINAEMRERADHALAADPSQSRTAFYLTADPADLRLKKEFDASPHSFGFTDTFFFALENSIYVALVLCAPIILWQMWQFVAAGLYRHEKRAVLRTFPFSVLLFAAGVVFCFLVVAPTGMYYLATTFGIEKIEPMIGIRQYTGFLTPLCLAMGFVFQLPVAMILLARIGLVEPRTYAHYRGHFVIGALVLSAVVTPGPDAVSQLLMTVPMLVLYEIGIVVARLTARPRQHPARA